MVSLITINTSSICLNSTTKGFYNSHFLNSVSSNIDKIWNVEFHFDSLSRKSKFSMRSVKRKDWNTVATKRSMQFLKFSKNPQPFLQPNFTNELTTDSQTSYQRRTLLTLFNIGILSECLLHPLHLQAAENYSPNISRSKKDDDSRPSFIKLDNGLQFIDVKEGNGDIPTRGEKVAIHYYARLGSKQGWRFDSTYEHKDSFGVAQPFEFEIGSSSVIAGLSLAVESMKVGGIRRVIIPPSLSYHSKSDEPLPPNFFDRQRLFTTIFNPTRLNNGEGDTLGTVIFDVQLLGKR